MSPEEVETIGQALLTIAANNLSIPKAFSLVVSAGLDGTAIPTMPNKEVGMGSRAIITSAIFAAWNKLLPAAKERALPILGEGVLRANAPNANEGRHLLEQHGFRFVDGAFVSLNISDERERAFLPPQAYDEIAKAGARLCVGDESGAITSACGAVDSLMQYIYGKYHFADPATTAFAAKINTAINRLEIFEAMENELLSLGMKPNDVNEIVHNT